VVDETFLVKEEIDVAWVFPRNPNLQDDNALSNKYNKCRIILVDVMDCQVHALSMKFGRVKETIEKTSEVNIATILIGDDTTTCAWNFLK
jgi:hypothetical protein